MQVAFVHLRRCRELADDLGARCRYAYYYLRSSELADGDIAGHQRQRTLDAPEYVGRTGFDTVAVDEHRQYTYGGASPPPVLGVILVHRTADFQQPGVDLWPRPLEHRLPGPDTGRGTSATAQAVRGMEAAV